MPTFSYRELSRERKRLTRTLGEEPKTSEHWRPKTYGDCKSMPRPCPFFGCKYNLVLDADDNGSIKINSLDSRLRLKNLLDVGGVRGIARIGISGAPKGGSIISADVGVGENRETLDELVEHRVQPQSCALDVADEGGKTLEEVGELLGITRERVRQIEASALMRIKDQAFDLLTEAMNCIPEDKSDPVRSFASTFRREDSAAELRVAMPTPDPDLLVA